MTRMPKLPANLQHRPVRPEWRCVKECGEWPCRDAKLTLPGLVGDELTLRLLMYGCLGAAAVDMSAFRRGDVDDFRQVAPRFVDWIGSSQVRPRGRKTADWGSSAAPMPRRARRGRPS